MFRLLVLLGGGLFLAMLIGGQDRGQLRFGLKNQKDETAIASPIVAEAEPVANLVEAAYVPEKPVMVQPVVAPAEATTAAAALDGKILFVTAGSANVRKGPGKDHAVVDRLSKGEAVLVVAEGEGPDGWSLIRIEGDGIEGYIASRLLGE